MTSNSNKKQFTDLLEAGKYDDAMQLINQLAETKEISAKDHHEWARTCLKKLAASLFTEGTKFANSKKYDKAAESLNSVKSLIMQNPELFGLSQAGLQSLLIEWTQEMKQMSSGNTRNMQELQDKLMLMAQKKFRGKEELMTLRMLLFALIFPALCENLPKK